MLLFTHPRFQGEEVDRSRNILTSQIGIFSLLPHQELQLGKGISKGVIDAKSLGRVGCIIDPFDKLRVKLEQGQV